jgi:cell wall-associated NlpC family hydrolase
LVFGSTAPQTPRLGKILQKYSKIQRIIFPLDSSVIITVVPYLFSLLHHGTPMSGFKSRVKHLCFLFVINTLYISTVQAGSEQVNTSPPPSSERKEQSTVKDVINRAHELLGTPYRWGGNSVSQGFDCSGLMVYLFRSEAGVRLPRTAAAMNNLTSEALVRKKLKPGDAVFFDINRRGRINHVGLYIGKNKFIHAPRKGKNIRIDSLNNKYWNNKFVSGKRFLRINHAKAESLNKLKQRL